MKPDARLSVCVPTYNQGDYISACLRSLLRQEVAPYEIVVSENRCTDCTGEVLLGFDGVVRVVRPGQHLEMVANYQFCAEQARGDWLVFMTSDDLAELGYVRHLLEGIAAHPEAVAVRAGHYLMDSAGQRVGKLSILRIPDYSSPEEAFAEQLGGPKALFEATAFRRSAWHQVGGFNMSLRLFGDWGLWVSLSQVGGFARIKHIVTSYRIWDRADRGVNRIPREMQDEIVIYRDMIYPRAHRLGGKYPILAERAAARRGHLMLDRLHQVWSAGQIAENRHLILHYGEILSCLAEARRLVAGSYRPAGMRRVCARVKTYVRGAAEQILGWK